jgi:hypothetical protein
MLGTQQHRRKGNMRALFNLVMAGLDPAIHALG